MYSIYTILYIHTIHEYILVYRGFHCDVPSTFCKSDLGLAVLAPKAELESISLGDRRSSGPRNSARRPLSCPTARTRKLRDLFTNCHSEDQRLLEPAAPGTLVFLRVWATGALRWGAQVFAGRPVRGMWGTCLAGAGLGAGWADGGETEGQGRGERTDRERDRKGRCAPSPSSRNTASESQLRLWPWSLSPAVPTSLVTRPPGQSPASWGLRAEEAA